MSTSYSKAIGYVNISIKGKDVVVSATAPSEPKLGDLWYDTVNNRLKRWTGTEWEPENSAELSGIQETLKTHSMDIIKNAEGISQLIKDTTIVSVNGEPVSIQEAYNYSVDTATEHSQIIAETKKELADDIQTQANRTTALTQNLDGFKQEVSSTYETKTDAGTNYSALSSSITHTASSIRSEMSSAISNSETNTKENYKSYVQQTAKDLQIGFDTSITAEKDRAEKVESDLSSKIELSAEGIKTEFTNNIENISSSVTQNANKIGWMIKSGDSASNMLLTDRMYSVIAENIDLTGRVTFSTFDSSLQSKINDAVAATSYWMLCSASAIVKSTSGTYSPSSITLSAKSQTGNKAVNNYSGRFAIYLNGSSTASYTSSSNESSKTYTIPSGTTSITCKLFASGGTSTILDQQTIPVVVDGAKGDKGDTGAKGLDAYTIVLTNESHTFAASTSSAIASNTTCNIIAYKGATQVSATIGTISGHPTGMTTSISNNGSTSAYFTVSVTTSMTSKNGVLSIPITVDGKTFTKKFTYSLAIKGDTGAKGDKGEKGDTGANGKDGTNGTDAISYWIEPSSYIVYKSVEGVLSPTSVTFKGYYRIGQGSTVACTGNMSVYNGRTVSGTAIKSSTSVSSINVSVASSYESLCCALIVNNVQVATCVVPVLLDTHALDVAFCLENDTTVIDGSKIATGTIHANAINVNSIFAKSATFTGSLLLNGGYLTTNSSRKTYNATVNGLTLDKNGIGGYYNEKQYFNLSKDGKLTCSGATITGDISADTLTLKTGIKIASTFIDGLSTVATSGKYSDLSGTPTIPTNVNQLTGGTNIMYTSNVSIGTAVTANGLTKKTITVNGKSFVSIESGDFVITNVGIGTNTTDNSKSYTYISKDGLLTAKNAVIYGTIYATNGSFSGTVSGATISGGTINGASVTGGNIDIGNGDFTVDSSGVATTKIQKISGRLEISATKYGNIALKAFGEDTGYGSSFVLASRTMTMIYDRIKGMPDVRAKLYQSGDMTNSDNYIYTEYDKCQILFNGEGISVSMSEEIPNGYRDWTSVINGNGIYTNFITLGYWGINKNYNLFTSTACSATGWQTYSDKELKKDIQNIPVAKSIDFICSLNPVSYIYKDAVHNRKHHGFIAQDVKESMGNDDWGLYIDPNFNSSSSAKSYKSLRYEEIIADLVNVVQDQHSRISQLESKIEEILNTVQN